MKQDRKQLFNERLSVFMIDFNDAVASNKGDWIIKGFIDIAKKVYTISVDTKVVSKIMEILLIPKFYEFAEKYHYKLVLTEHQNHYPDLTFIDNENFYYAVDIKSSYRKNLLNINGMTLGAFTGYFRNRNSNKNILVPYSQYVGHFVFGLIYSRIDNLNEKEVFGVNST